MEKAPKALCDACALKNAIFVPSEINGSTIVALAEAPGYNEAKEGRPLVGVAGQDLNKIIEFLGKGRKDINYVNAVTCRPTKVIDGKTYNRTPTDEEIKCCNQRLIAELEKLTPTIIVCMGKTPYVALGGDKKAIMREIVGSTFTWKSKFDIIVTYHPAAISHSGGVGTERGKKIRDEIEQAFKTAFVTKPKPKQLALW